MSTHKQTRHPTRRAMGRGTGVRSVAAVAGLALVVGLLGGCDTGDGKTLSEPTGTLPPPTVPPSATDLPVDGADTLASVPLESPVLDGGAQLPAPSVPFGVVAPWIDGGQIEPINTCDGDNVSPAISWVDVPEGTVELAVALVDESNNDGPLLIHWVVAGLNPADISVLEGSIPLGAVQGLNLFGNVGFDGPCPPAGDPAHVYRLTIYALNQQTELVDGTAGADLLDFVQTVAIAAADVTGTYAR